MPSPERIRFSTLKAFALSPAHFRHASRTELEPSRAMRIGTATHAALLGGDVAVFDGTRRGKAWDEFFAANTHRPIVSRDEQDVADECANAVLSDPVARPIMTGLGTNETRIDWSFRGVPFRSTPDRVVGSTLVELKTCRTAEPGAFMREAQRRHYHAQLAVYREALASVGTHVDRCVIVAVETSAPYAVTVLELTESALDIGYRLACSWLERYIVCQAADSWPGYSQTVVRWDIQPEIELDFGEDSDDE